MATRIIGIDFGTSTTVVRVHNVGAGNRIIPLTREQRYAIYLGKQKHETNKAIAQAINVSESTVCRELKRHATKNGKYLWIQADESATRKKHRAPGNRAVRPEVRWRVEQLIKDEQWSPKQISGFLAKEGISIGSYVRMKPANSQGTAATR